MEQLHAIAPLTSPSTSNATLPQWQLPLYFTLALLSLYWLLKKVNGKHSTVNAEAELGEKLDRVIDIFYRQIHEYFSSHVFSF
jgi:hypothetical protein